MLGPEAWQERQRLRAEKEEEARNAAEVNNRQLHGYVERASLSRRSVRHEAQAAEERRKAISALSRPNYCATDSPLVVRRRSEKPSEKVERGEKKLAINRSSRFSLFRKSQRAGEKERLVKEQAYKALRQRPLYHCSV